MALNVDDLKFPDWLVHGVDRVSNSEVGLIIIIIIIYSIVTLIFTDLFYIAYQYIFIYSRMFVEFSTNIVRKNKLTGLVLLSFTSYLIQEWRVFIEQFSSSLQQMLNENGIARFQDLRPAERQFFVDKTLREMTNSIKYHP